MCNKTATLAKEQNITNTSENPHICHPIHSLFSKDNHYPYYMYDSLLYGLVLLALWTYVKRILLAVLLCGLFPLLDIMFLRHIHVV